MRMMYYAGGPFVLHISQNLWQPDIRALAIAAGWNGVSEVLVSITSTFIGPIDLGTVPYHNGITINVASGSRIGGTSGDTFVLAGGPALKTRIPVNINNAGIISGGGGKGGDGGEAQSAAGNATASAYGGQGGVGQGLVNGGGGLCAVRPAAAGQPGTYASDKDIIIPPYPECWAQGGSGGAGGAWGQAGAPGAIGTWGGDPGVTGNGWSGEPGGFAGAAVDGNSHVTWLATGTRLGGLIN